MCRHSGFTLVEILLTIALFSVVIAFTISTDVAGYLRFTIREERDVLVSLLQKARMEAVNNVHMTAHGVAIQPHEHPGEYVLFEGEPYDNPSRDRSSDRIVPYREGLDISEVEIVFEQLSGTILNVPGELEIIISDPQSGATTTVSVNHEGRISW